MLRVPALVLAVAATASLAFGVQSASHTEPDEEARHHSANGDDLAHGRIFHRVFRGQLVSNLLSDLFRSDSDLHPEALNIISPHPVGNVRVHGLDIIFVELAPRH